jgi:hypothetical protein
MHGVVVVLLLLLLQCFPAPTYDLKNLSKFVGH